MLELLLRQVVRRHGDKMKDWNISKLQITVFGDRQAAVLLQVVIRMTCGIYKSIDIRAAEKIQNDLFVDDLVTRGELDEVHRLMGNMNDENFKCSGTMTQIMEKEGLHLRGMGSLTVRS